MTYNEMKTELETIRCQFELLGLGNSSVVHCIREILSFIENQQAEKEALIAGQETMSKYIEEQQAEIERLSKKNEELAEILSDTIRIRYAEAKTEAIKEFAERLKSRLITVTYMNFDDTIDNLVKEMVGEAE